MLKIVRNVQKKLKGYGNKLERYRKSWNSIVKYWKVQKNVRKAQEKVGKVQISWKSKTSKISWKGSRMVGML